MFFVLFCIVICTVLIISYVILEKVCSTQKDSCIFNLSPNDSAIFVISHPDDESLFFAPTILELQERKVNVHVLCLSTGNYYGKGVVRSKEFHESCAKLGLEQSNVYCLNDFEDGPNEEWNPKLVSKTLKIYLQKTRSKCLFTFDQHGISGHPNHIALNTAVKYMIRQEINHSVDFYELQTVPLYRKYIQIIDIIPTLFTAQPSHTIVASSYNEYLKSISSMLCHESQLVWFRWLVVMFSRNMWLNT
uniref:N-acetylglucosaminylphosphatidylinositol deacetylase n=1 Tax=Ciona savignyi TaxID=51511 RepID=H2YEQ2_CIOSA